MKLLKKLYSIYSGSHHTEPMQRFIKGWVKRNLSETTVTQDTIGNIYITKGRGETYPCIVAHMDQVQSPYPDDYEVVSDGWTIRGLSRNESHYRGLGADDKNGIWVALKTLLNTDCIKVALFVDEEIGCVGSRKCNMTFFADCRWVVQCDRMNGGDFINHTNGTDVCSREFENAIPLADYGYRPAHGSVTDVGTLKNNGLKVSCCNLSCGYYNPHTENEYTVIEDLMRCYTLVMWMVEHLTKVYPHEKARIVYEQLFSTPRFNKPMSAKEKQKEEMEEIVMLAMDDYLADNWEIGEEGCEELAKQFYDENGKRLNLLSIDDWRKAIDECVEELCGYEVENVND